MPWEVFGTSPQASAFGTASGDSSQRLLGTTNDPVSLPSSNVVELCRPLAFGMPLANPRAAGSVAEYPATPRAKHCFPKAS
mmetsp:Transcript_35057/g.99381  ORF Transcript_35057/g.99381 Transcript_35057/m.99381 type:complete len:81 (-) Transcript_35057:40-282(-)